MDPKDSSLQALSPQDAISKMDQLDKIIDRIEPLFNEAKFDEIEDMLRTLDVENTDTPSLLMYLSATSFADIRRYLPHRQGFVERVEAALKLRGKDTEQMLRFLR